MTGPLHVTNGDVVADAIAAASLDGTTLVWADVLHTGPLDHDLERSRAVRARFLARCGWGEADVIQCELEARDDGLVRTVDATPLPPTPPRGDVQRFADVVLELTPAGRAHV